MSAIAACMLCYTRPEQASAGEAGLETALCMDSMCTFVTSPHFKAMLCAVYKFCCLKIE